MKVLLNSIGIIKTPFHDLKNMPVQPIGAKEQIGKIVIKDEYISGLKDLDGFNFIYLIYYFHRVDKHDLQPIPFNDRSMTPRGVFSTRTPVHPNNIGLSLVELIEVNTNIVKFKGVDILDDTPLLDIKPYIKNFDYVKEPTSGWMRSSLDEVKKKRSDDRFVF